MAQLSSTTDQDPGPTLSQVGSLSETAVSSVRIRTIETMQVLPEVLDLFPMSDGRRTGRCTYKKPRENMKRVMTFCFVRSLSLRTDGNGSAKMTKSVTVDMMDEVNHTGYVGRHLSCMLGTITDMGMHVTARMMTCVMVQRIT